jgi:hypothetical protein
MMVHRTLQSRSQSKHDATRANAIPTNQPGDILRHKRSS